MVEKNKLLAWRKIISPFCKKAEKHILKICDNTSTEDQWALKET